MSTGPITPQRNSSERVEPEKRITETKWWNDLMDGIYGPRKGGARIIIDAQDASTGAGKTGLAVSLALILSKVFGYEMHEDDMTLSGAHYLKRWRQHPGSEQPSVIILDELGGAGAGHARRSMSHQNVELGNAWQLMRKKRIVSIVTLPHWTKVDKDMRQQADFRLWCLTDPIGYFKPYHIGAHFDRGGVTTTGYNDVSRIRFPNLDKHGEKFYRSLAEKKDELLDSDVFDADKLLDENQEEQKSPKEVRKETKIEVAQELRNDGMSLREIAPKVGYSYGWVQDNTEPPEEDDD